MCVRLQCAPLCCFTLSAQKRSSPLSASPSIEHLLIAVLIQVGQPEEIKVQRADERDVEKGRVAVHKLRTRTHGRGRAQRRTKKRNAHESQRS
eukprot:6184350-Pleurochrysis_carterae.AAC.2